MRIVRRDHKAAGNRAHGRLGISVKSGKNAGEHIPEEGRCSALLGRAAHFLIVKDGTHIHMAVR